MLSFSDGCSDVKKNILADVVNKLIGKNHDGQCWCDEGSGISQMIMNVVFLS